MNRRAPSWTYRLLTGGCAALVLLLGCLAASPDLHARLHTGAGNANHACAIVLYEHGVPAPAAAFELPAVDEHFAATVVSPLVDLFLSAPRHLLQPGRGPPAA